MGPSSSTRRLRGHSFRGQDLHSTQLHGADLRGTDFTNADLRGADLSAVRTGRAPMASVVLGAATLLGSIALGVVAGRAAAYVRGLLEHPAERYRVAGWVITAEFVVFLVVLLWKGLGPALRDVTAVFALAALTAGLVAVLLGAGTGAAAARIILLVSLSAVLAALGSFLRAAGGTIQSWVFYVVALAGALATRGADGGILVAALAIVSAVIGKRMLRGDPRYVAMARWTRTFALLGGTRFRGADLTDATFRAARLRNSDFRGARLGPDQLKDAKELALCTFDAESR